MNKETMYAASRKIEDVISEVKKAVIGKDEVIIKVMLALLAGGHILIEDIPGVGKTTMALAFSRALSLECNRMQFTPDVLPTDITGFSMYRKDTGKFEYKPGVAVCNLFLADEINRTSCKTQSALLEIMEEGSISIDGKRFALPKPYMVIATQNPAGSIGTQMLPESQLDRFMIKINMGYPDVKSEVYIMKSKKNNTLDKVKTVAASSDVDILRKLTENIYTDDGIYDYMARLASATRNNAMIKLGISPRGTLALAAMSRASALVNGRTYVIPDDVSFVFADTICHRIIPDNKAKLSGMSRENIASEILASTPVPRIRN